jgi:hypothetical protein
VAGSDSALAFAWMVARLALRHSWTHPEGWRDWPYETPATTVTSQRERCQFQRDVWRAFVLFATP